ncbi:MAG: PEGA domain-containing protein [Deltaproteobacteria bacterium]|nr:MAG: PEGA domain-containing protein [Deltaproteobacteria bacterium]
MGAVLFQMLTGKSPLEMDLDHLEADVSPQIARILRKAVAKDPDDRFQSGQEFADALREVLSPPSRWGASGHRSTLRSLLYVLPLVALLGGGAFVALQGNLWQRIAGSPSDSGSIPIREEHLPPAKVPTAVTERQVEHTPQPAAPPTETRHLPATRPVSARVAERQHGTLKVFSNVAGTLSIDEENRGWIEAGRSKTIHLPPGTHRVVLSNRELNIREARTVEVEAGGIHTFKVQKELRGTLVIETNVPGLAVFVDGVKRGTTSGGSPLKLPLPAGSHTVRLAHSQFGIDETHQVRVGYRKTASLSRNYVGRYQISTNIKVSVKLDGKLIHKTPVDKFTLEATPGSHWLELINPIELPAPHKEKLVFHANKTHTKMILLQGR